MKNHEHLQQLYHPTFASLLHYPTRPWVASRKKVPIGLSRSFDMTPTQTIRDLFK